MYPGSFGPHFSIVTTAITENIQSQGPLSELQKNSQYCSVYIYRGVQRFFKIERRPRSCKMEPAPFFRIYCIISIKLN